MKNETTITTEFRLTPTDGGNNIKVTGIKGSRNDIMVCAEAAALEICEGYYRQTFDPMTLMLWPGCQSPPRKLTEEVAVRVETTYGNNNPNDPLVLNGAFVAQKVTRL
jgi:hypothetical protein